MDTMTTPREIRSPQNGRVPNVDSPAVRARARAMVPVTHSTSNLGDRVRAGVSKWWALTTRPLSLRATWKLSAVDPSRIPEKNTTLRLLWQASNWSDRLILFALTLTLPTAFTGPLRWVAVRPTRRYGLYLTIAGLLAAHLIGKATA